MNPPVLVSACLLGIACRYDGRANPCPAVLALAGEYALIPFCPEVYGGLPTPRKSAEIRNGRVVACDGQDVTKTFRQGAEEALALARRMGCRTAILKERSPSCGLGRIYDGSFTGRLVPGSGVTAELLQCSGIRVYGESQIGPDGFFSETSSGRRDPL